MKTTYCDITDVASGKIPGRRNSRRRSPYSLLDYRREQPAWFYSHGSLSVVRYLNVQFLAARRQYAFCLVSAVCNILLSRYRIFRRETGILPFPKGNGVISLWNNPEQQLRPVHAHPSNQSLKLRTFYRICHGNQKNRYVFIISAVVRLRCTHVRMYSYTWQSSFLMWFLVSSQKNLWTGLASCYG